MKTKFYWLSLLAGAAMIAPANAGGHHGGGGGGGSFAAPSTAGHAAAPSLQSGGGRSFGGGRMTYSGHHFAPTGGRAISPTGMPQRHLASNGARQFTAGKANSSNHVARNRTGTDRAVTNTRRAAGTGQARRGNGLPNNWRNHVAAQNSANWHRDWNRNRDHTWHGHHCRFINGSWVIFDFGFDPWWPYWYPYDYYAYGYPYPYGYEANDYGTDVYQGQPVYGDDSYNNGFVAAAQKRLAVQGYYEAQIDGILGQQTSRALARFQRNHGLQVNGNLDTDTLAALGLSRVASN